MSLGFDVGALLASPVFAGTIAALGAATGILALARPRPKLRVTARMYDPQFRNVTITFERPASEGNPVCIEVTNTGRRAVTVRELGFEMRPPLKTPHGDVSFMQIADSQLPVSLDPGQAHTAYGPAAKLSLEGFHRAVAIDTEGRRWSSSRRPFGSPGKRPKTPAA